MGPTLWAVSEVSRRMRRHGLPLMITLITENCVTYSSRFRNAGGTTTVRYFTATKQLSVLQA
jgi:hypothetical protein